MFGSFFCSSAFAVVPSIVYGLMSVSLTFASQAIYYHFHISTLTVLLIRSLFTCLFGFCWLAVFYKSSKMALTEIGRYIKNYKLIAVLFLPSITTCFWYIGISKININIAILISFLQPILVIVIGKISQKSPVSYGMLFSVLVSFFGVITYLGLDFKAFNSAIWILICVAAARAFYQVLVKKALSSNCVPLPMIMFLVNLLNTILLSFKAGEALSINPKAIPLVLLVLSFSLLYNICYFAAVKLTKHLSSIQGYDFLRIAYSALFSYVLYHEVLSYQEVLGVAIVIASNIYSYIHNSKK